MTREELTEARQKLGLDKKQMAEALNTPYTTYYKWERGSSDRAGNIPGVVDIAVQALLEKHAQ